MLLFRRDIYYSRRHSGWRGGPGAARAHGMARNWRGAYMLSIGVCFAIEACVPINRGSCGCWHSWYGGVKWWRAAKMLMARQAACAIEVA